MCVACANFVTTRLPLHHPRAYRDTPLHSEFLSDFFALFAPFAVNYPIPNLFFGCGFAALGPLWLTLFFFGYGSAAPLTL